MLKKISLAILVLVIAIQFIRPARNLSSEPSPNDIVVAHSAPPRIRQILEKACYDCHSNNTRYPWYVEIQPFGWLMAYHVKEGRQHVNFEEFAAYSPKRARLNLEEAADEVYEAEMPLKFYTFLHPPARLTEDERTALARWFETVQSTIRAPATEEK